MKDSVLSCISFCLIKPFYTFLKTKPRTEQLKQEMRLDVWNSAYWPCMKKLVCFIKLQLVGLLCCFYSGSFLNVFKNIIFLTKTWFQFPYFHFYSWTALQYNDTKTIFFQYHTFDWRQFLWQVTCSSLPLTGLDFNCILQPFLYKHDLK